MRFVIHVIDNSSIYKLNKQNKKYEIVKYEEDDNKNFHILESDAFYLIDEKKAINAITTLASTIKIEINEEKIPLSEAIIQTKKNMNNVEIGSDNPDYKLTNSDLKIENNAYGNIISASCQFEIKQKENTYEAHNIRFYIVPENKIMEILNI